METIEVLYEILADCETEEERNFVKELLLLPESDFMTSNREEDDNDPLESLKRSLADEWKEQEDNDSVLQQLIHDLDLPVSSPRLASVRTSEISHEINSFSSSTFADAVSDYKIRRVKREHNICSNAMRRNNTAVALDAHEKTVTRIQSDMTYSDAEKSRGEKAHFSEQPGMKNDITTMIKGVAPDIKGRKDTENFTRNMKRVSDRTSRRHNREEIFTMNMLRRVLPDCIDGTHKTEPKLNANMIERELDRKGRRENQEENLNTNMTRFSTDTTTKQKRPPQDCKIRTDNKKEQSDNTTDTVSSSVGKCVARIWQPCALLISKPAKADSEIDVDSYDDQSLMRRLSRRPSTIHIQRRRCRSAPELRPPVERSELFPNLSQCHLPFSPSPRPDGRKVLHFEKDEEEHPWLLWGDEAYTHYQLLSLVEQKENLELIQGAKRKIIRRFMWKQKVLDEIVKVARDYYRNPNEENQQKWKKLRRSINQASDTSLTDLQHQLAFIPLCFPFFTLFLMTIHVLSLIIMCAVGGVAPAGLMSRKEKSKVPTFLGDETVYRYVTPNPWIGPPITTLLDFGAALAPCLRMEERVEMEGERLGYRQLNDRNFGCCQMGGVINTVGTTTESECMNYTKNTRTWSRPFCSKRGRSLDGVAHFIRPCCIDHRGTCRMTSRAHCIFLGGYWHGDVDHCVEVLCIRDICTIGKNFSVISADPAQPWLPHANTKWQWWRPLVASLYTYGFVDLVVVLTVEWLLMRPLENTSGGVVIFFTYIMCSLAGQIVSLMAQPYVPQLGSMSGVAGMVGKAAVELCQAWRLLDSPRREVAKLGVHCSALVVLGFFPYVSLLGVLTGGGCGLGYALIFGPFVSSDKWSEPSKAVEVIGAIVVLLVFMLVITYIFITLQPTPCQACRAIDCLSFSTYVCNHWDLLG